MMILVRLL
jgi:hypothetical protein